MGRGQNLLNLVKKIKQEKQIEEIKTEIAEVIKPENLKAGITAFGIEGNKNIVDTSDANLNDYYLHPNYIGYSKGSKIKGRMPVSTEDQLQYFSSTQTMLNPEYPNFILLRHYPAGTIKGEIKTISANAINSEWIKNKNICIRANYNPNLTYWIHDWHVEIAVCENDCRFQFRNSNGEQPIYCIYKDTGNSAPYTLYQAWCNDLSELTIDNWEKKDIAANSNMNNSLGKIGSLYAYSRDKSVTTTGLTSSTGIMSSKGKIYFKNKINANATPSYLSNNNNGAFIDIIDENKLTQFINLTPEHIKKGETYLGIEGTMEEGIDTSDATATANDILKDKTAYVNGEKIVGTNDNNNNAIVGTTIQLGGSNYSGLNKIIKTVPDDLVISGTSASYMFNNCSSLEKISSLDTSNVTRMESMFLNCSSLKEVPSLNTSKVTYMSSMFSGCSSLEKIPSLDTSKATNVQYMFRDCTSLKEVPLLNLTASTSGDSMFLNCSSLKEIPLLNISNITNMTSMFSGCSSLKKIPLLDTSKVTNMNSTFNGTALETIPLLNTSKVTNMAGMFQNCNLLKEIPLFDTANVRNMQNTFWGCNNLSTIPLLNTSKVTNMMGMFRSSGIKEIPLLDTSKVIDMRDMIRDCYLTTIPEFNTTSLINMELFAYHAPHLSDESLNNILAMCTKATKITNSSYKKLSYIGLSSTQATRCQTLSNYDAFIAAGWTTGY